MSLRADQHHANPRPKHPLFYIFLPGCRVLTISHLNHFHYLFIAQHPCYFCCIDVGELCYKVSNGLPLDCRSGAVAHIELPQPDCPLEEST